MSVFLMFVVPMLRTGCYVKQINSISFFQTFMGYLYEGTG